MQDVMIEYYPKDEYPMQLMTNKGLTILNKSFFWIDYNYKSKPMKKLNSKTSYSSYINAHLP